MNEFWSSVVTIGVAIIGVAFLAVLVAPNAQTSNVLGAAGKALGGALTAAEGPVLGGGGNGLPNLSFPGSGAGYINS